MLDLITEGLFKLALTITLVLRVNRIVRWDIHSIWMNEWIKYPFPIYVVQNSKIKFFNFRKWVLNNWCRKCPRNWKLTHDFRYTYTEVLWEKNVLQNFAKFTEKQRCQGPVFKKLDCSLFIGECKRLFLSLLVNIQPLKKNQVPGCASKIFH